MLTLLLRQFGFVSSYLILLFTGASLVKVYCDNVSATYLSANPIHHDCSKHIEIHYNFMHEHVIYADANVVVTYVPTKLHLANIFTKGSSFSIVFIS